MDLKELAWEVVDWINLIEDKTSSALLYTRYEHFSLEEGGNFEVTELLLAS